MRSVRTFVYCKDAWGSGDVIEKRHSWPIKATESFLGGPIRVWSGQTMRPR